MNRPLKKPRFIIRKSPIVVVMKLLVLQIIFILTYLLLRLTKNVLFYDLMYANSAGSMQFWLGIGLFLVLSSLQLGIAVYILLQWNREQYEIRNDSIVHTRGIFENREEIYSLRGVEAGKVRQTTIGRILNFGTVSVFSPVLKKEYFLYDIPNPELMKHSILALLQNKSSKDQKIIPVSPQQDM